MLLALYLAVAAATPAAALQEPPRSDEQNVVVTGVRIQDFRDRLAACLARNCPPNEDIDATLALAEALFLNGDYAEGRSFVRASIGRNRDRARDYPEPVSDLYRAGTRLSRHIGYDREARTSSFEILNALQAGIPQEDHRHFTARFEIAEMQMMSGSFRGARRELQRLIRAARAAGREDVALLAELRDTWYELIAYPASDARAQLIRWSRDADPTNRMRAVGARILLARVYRSEGDAARSDALLAELGVVARAGAHRRILHAPRYQLFQQDVSLSTQDVGEPTNVLNRVTENYQDKWIDVGFWINPDGSVSGLELLRSGANPDWSEPLLRSIRGRLYNAGPEQTYRLERYTMTGGFETPTGSHIRRRGPAARVEYLDLTANEPDTRPAAAPPPSE
jgi:hypothetical protein